MQIFKEMDLDFEMGVEAFSIKVSSELPPGSL